MDIHHYTADKQEFTVTRQWYENGRYYLFCVYAGSWTGVNLRDSNPPYCIHIHMKETTCCGIREMYGFEFSFSNKSNLLPATEALLYSARQVHHGSLLWVFVEYSEGELQYSEVMEYLIKTYSAPQPQPQHNPNSGHMLYPVIHVTDLDNLIHDWSSDDDDEY